MITPTISPPDPITVHSRCYSKVKFPTPTYSPPKVTIRYYTMYVVKITSQKSQLLNNPSKILIYCRSSFLALNSLNTCISTKA